MQKTRTRVALALRSALRQLMAKDSYLMENDVAERSIGARLAAYLVPMFPDHDVDVEYNRHGLEVKTLELPEYCRGGGKRKVFPDVVVHQRGHDDENLLVIQLKKETNAEPRKCDRAVIEAMMRDFRYRHGVLVELPAGPGAAGRKARLDWR